MCIRYENQFLKSVVNFVITSFWRVFPKPRDIAPPKMQVHDFISDEKKLISDHLWFG